ncbi:MAG: hypothetical protein AB1Z51_00800 [Desulfuromonadales bacterium]
MDRRRQLGGLRPVDTRVRPLRCAHRRRAGAQQQGGGDEQECLQEGSLSGSR